MATITPVPEPLAAPEMPASGFLGIHHLEIYVGNARQSSHYYRTVCGFEPVARAGLETGQRDEYAIAMTQGSIGILLKSALRPDAPAAEFVRRHGEGVHDIAFEVTDAAAQFERAIQHGATPILAPTEVEDEQGAIVRAIIGTHGSVRHSFIQRNGYAGTFLPGMQACPAAPARPGVGLTAIDHVAFSLKPGSLQEWADFYGEALGFQLTRREDVSTAYSGMNSCVVEDANGRVKFPLVEPRAGLRKSQIEEYLCFNGGPGAQHAALHTDDIIGTIRNLREAGLEFLRTPQTYYELLPARVGTIDEQVGALRDLCILVDRDPSGYLLQIFSQPLDSRPTFFLEVIQRKGATGFGSGNIRALFEAVEREQALRGNL
jgi:4-hydroxyphenylpyruvate dioxygenase